MEVDGINMKCSPFIVNMLNLKIGNESSGRKENF